MTVDFSTLFQTFYPPGTGRVYVAPTTQGNGSGSSAANAMAGISAGINALGSAGGIVYVADGNYSGVATYGKNFAANAWCLIMAQNYLGPHITTGGGGSIFEFDASSYIGIYGLYIDGINGTIMGVRGMQGAHHQSTWRCFITNCDAGIGYPGNSGPINHIDACYNIVSECAHLSVDPIGQSGITLYELSDYGGGDDAYGYSNYVVGNICFNNSQNGGQTDGNGIIIDDNKFTQNAGTATTCHTLLMGNLSVHNGGRGVHTAFSTRVDSLFNTAGQNRYLHPGTEGGDITAILSDTCQVKWNVANPISGGWFEGYATDAATFDTNVYLSGANVDTGGLQSINPRNRTVDGSNYFKNNAPTTSPSTLVLADQWRPDGGAGIIEKVVLDQTTYDKISRWPDLFGDYRPARTAGWALGFAEVSSVAVVPVVPVAAFTYSPTSPRVGDTINISNQASGPPTTYSYNWGDGTAASTTASPSHVYATAGSYTITQTVTNGLGSNAKSHTITVTSIVTPPSSSNRELVDFNVANRAGFPPSNYGTGWGHQEYN